MILSENQIKVPGKMYKVRVKCVSTQRLTTIEWLILSCTKKFEHQSSMSGRTLKYAFEEVFQFQNSELLIKPCLKHLRRLEVINIAGGDTFNYDSLRFADIELTELGDIMLKDGLLPGEPREIGLDVYYNPLTGKLSGYDNSPTNVKECMDFGTDSDYDQNFPEQHVIDELQAGSVGGGRFIASKFRIEEIESLTSTDWECVITMAVDVNEKGEIKTTPEIVEPNVNRLIPSLFMTKEITKQLTDNLPEIGSLEVRHVIGSSKNIKEAILDVCKNGKFVFIDAKIYQLYKRNTASFKDTTVVLFNSEDGLSIENEKGMFIHIPDAFPIPGCVVVNEKGEHVSLCKSTYSYGEEQIIAPLAIEDKRLGGKNKVAIKWLEDTIRTHYQEDIRYAGLITLPPLAGNLKGWRDNLYTRWIGMELEAIVQEINKIHVTCLQLKRDMFDISLFADVLLEKVDSADYETVLNNIKVIMDSHCIRKNSAAHRSLVESIVGRIKAPNTYPDLYRMLESLGITTHDEAMVFDDVIGKFYSEEIIKNILANIADGTYTKLPELFEFDVFFNEYVEGLQQIEKHVSELHLFEKMDEELLHISVELCPNIAGLQSYMAEILAKNAYLMTRGINVYDVLRKADAEKAANFFANMRSIEKYIEQKLQGEYVQEKEHYVTVAKPEEKRKMYILDTCALMHNPELFLYFTEDEYVRIPTKVIDELGKIKDKRNQKYDASLSDTARRIARDIDMYYLQLFNRQNKIRFLIENAALDLLPKDLDAKVPDNQILSVALKYKDWETYIVSDDGVFRLTAQAQSIQAITGAKFIEMHQDTKKELTEWIKSANAQSADASSVVTETVNNPKEEIPVETKKEEKQVTTTVTTVDAAVSDSEEPAMGELAIDDMPIRELKKYIRAIPEAEGPLPKLTHVEDVTAEKKYVTDLVKAYLKQKSNISIGIIAGRNLQIKTYAAWMTDAGIPHEIIQRDTTFSMAKPGVKIVNVFNAKGLEFTRVIIPQFIEGNFPYRFQSDDEEEMQAFLAKSRNLIYVGMTRAKYSLDIVYSGDNGSRFIGEMDETLYESSGLAITYSSGTNATSGGRTKSPDKEPVTLPPTAPPLSEGKGGKDLKGFLESKGLEVIDKRAAGGCLWVVGDKAKIASVITEAGKLYGAYGNYSGGGKATKNRPGWFTKCKK